MYVFYTSLNYLLSCESNTNIAFCWPASFKIFPTYMNSTEELGVNERFMEEALKEASNALARNEVPIGAIVVISGKIVARAHNLTETLSDPTAHAEMQAITAATAALGGKYLPDATIYVTVEPCPMCAAALYWAQIGKLVYGAHDPKRGYTLVTQNLLHPKTVVVKDVLGLKASQLMKDFFRKKR